MKYRMILSLALGSSLVAQPPPPLPLSSKRCDDQYRDDMLDILRQFSGFTDPATRAIFKKYMILVKLFVDLGFQLRPIEVGLTSPDRARLRTPLQHYVDCRGAFVSALGLNVFDPSPTKEILSPCEATYALELMAALNYYGTRVSTATLEYYQDLMVILKRYQDVAFRLKDFENKISYDVYTRLRFPMRRYNNCKDAIIRNILPYAPGSLLQPLP